MNGGKAASSSGAGSQDGASVAEVVLVVDGEGAGKGGAKARGSPGGKGAKKP